MEYAAVPLVLLIIAIIVITQTIKFVPQQNALGARTPRQIPRHHDVPGPNFLIPFIDRVAYKHSLKEIPPRRRARSASRVTTHNCRSTASSISR